jgi:hypothetical protein
MLYFNYSRKYGLWVSVTPYKEKIKKDAYGSWFLFLTFYITNITMHFISSSHNKRFVFAHYVRSDCHCCAAPAAQALR